MTYQLYPSGQPGIIPYQELLGNYDHIVQINSNLSIIPYQELLGNYDRDTLNTVLPVIIPYQELLGNYDPFRVSQQLV